MLQKAVHSRSFFPLHLVPLGVTGHFIVLIIYFLKFTLCYDLWSASLCFFFSFSIGNQIKERCRLKFSIESLGITRLFNELSVHLCEQSVLFMKSEV